MEPFAAILIAHGTQARKLEGLGSAVSSPAGLRAELRPQMYCGYTKSP